jgi:hypothetical protein
MFSRDLLDQNDRIEIDGNQRPAGKLRLKAAIPAIKEMRAAFTDFALTVLQRMTAGDEPQLVN